MCHKEVMAINAEPTFTRAYGGIGDETARSIIQTNDGGYALAGYIMSSDYDDFDFWLVKTDSSGNLQWNMTYGGTDTDKAHSVIQTGDGGYALVGYTRSFGSGSADFWLVKTDASGNMLWSQTYGGIGWDWGNKIVETSDGGYTLAGYTGSYGAGDNDFWLVKTDANGNIQWHKTYGGTDDDQLLSMVQTSDGGYALAGATDSRELGEDFWLAKVEPQSPKVSLIVSSVYGSPTPSVGTHSHTSGSSVTASVNSPVTIGNNVWTCTGWSGTGSVPSSGSSTSITFTITQDSSITWHWLESMNPDLVVSDFSWEPSSPTTGDTVTFSYVIKNQGDVAAEKFSIALYIDDELMEFSTGESLAGGLIETRSFDLDWTSIEGSHTVEIVVDDIDEITEQDENNNKMIKILTVKEKSGEVDIETESSLGARKLLYTNFARAINGQYWVDKGIDVLNDFGEDFVSSFVNPFAVLKRVATKRAVGDYSSAELVGKEIGATISTINFQSMAYTINWAYSQTNVLTGYHGGINNASKKLENIFSMVESENYVGSRANIVDLINYLMVAKNQVDGIPQLADVKQTTKNIFESSIYFLQAEFESLIESGTSVTLQEDQHKLYLHVYDSQGRHVGFNHEQNRTEIDIPNVNYLDLGKRIIIVLPASLTDFNCEVDATSAALQTESYDIEFACHTDGNITYAKNESGSIEKGENNNYVVNSQIESEFIQVSHEIPFSIADFWYLFLIAVIVVPIAAYLLFRRKAKLVTPAHENR